MKEEMLIAGIQKPGRQERGHIHYNKVARMFHSGMSNESPRVRSGDTTILRKWMLARSKAA